MSRNPFDAAKDALYKKLSGAGLGKIRMAVALCFLNNTSRIKYDAAEGLLSYPGLKRLVAETKQDRSNIRRAIRALVAMGFMSLERQHKASRISDRYRLDEDWQPPSDRARTAKARAALAAKRAAAQQTAGTGVATEQRATGVATEPKTPTGVTTDQNRGHDRPSTGVTTEQEIGLSRPLPSVLPAVSLPADAASQQPLPVSRDERATPARAAAAQHRKSKVINLEAARLDAEFVGAIENRFGTALTKEGRTTARKLRRRGCDLELDIFPVMQRYQETCRRKGQHIYDLLYSAEYQIENAMRRRHGLPSLTERAKLPKAQRDQR